MLLQTLSLIIVVVSFPVCRVSSASLLNELHIGTALQRLLIILFIGWDGGNLRIKFVHFVPIFANE